MNSIWDRIQLIIELIFRFLLCVSAYLPMFIVLVLKNIDDLRICLVLIIFFILLPILIVRLYLSYPLKREANYPITIENKNRKENEIMNYVSGYILSLISFNSDIFTTSGIDIPNLIGVGILFLVICSLYMKSNMYDINPILTLFYNILDVTDINGRNVTLIVDRKIDLQLNRRILVRKISPDIFLYTTDRKNKITFVKITILFFILMLFLFLWNTDFHRIILKLFNMFN